MNFDIGDIVIKTGVSAGVFSFLRKYLETSVTLPKWDKLLQNLWIGAGIFILISHLLSLNLFIDEFYFFILIIVGYILRKSNDVRSARLLLTAVIPVLVFSVINIFFKYVTPSFHTTHNDVFKSAKIFTNLWLIGFGIYAQRQNKSEKVQRKKDEAERKELEDQKNTLENLVAERTAELTKQKEELEKALVELKATQNQLIQSEKLASLGELTAGIAHEIQNPLNFVNNFAELSVDITKDLNFEMHKPDIDKDYVEGLLKDLSSNQEKINYHGKRASSIVKGMLEHSRTTPGKKELIDINALVDEYFRLAYHGLRAKDKNFNAEMLMNFDPKIPKIGIIGQDVGRVILNLINNAFYAVNERKNREEALQTSHYQPSVTVITQKVDKSIEIRIKDNGTGIPENVKEKIFQPFFTTKPTGQGTGLGLSLAYDIITKGHGGSLNVESEEGVGSEFVIILPLK